VKVARGGSNSRHTRNRMRGTIIIVSTGIAGIGNFQEQRNGQQGIVVYCEARKRELNRRLINECRCDERLKAKAEGSTRLAYTGLRGGLEHLKIETKLIDERFESVMGECVI
jgi:hypothetical protein